MKTNPDNQNLFTRRGFLTVAAAAPFASAGILFGASLRKNETTVSSPNGQIRFTLDNDRGTQFNYRVSFRGKPVIETSKLGITIDGIGLGSGTDIRRVDPYRARETYGWRGGHSVAVNHYRGLRIQST